MKRMFFMLAMMGLLFGCGGDPADHNQTEHSNDAPGDGDGDGAGDGESCELVQECGTMCGEVDDGCGGTIFCGPCACVDGEAQSESCGVCDLGAIVCGAGETSAGSCEVPEIPGATGCDDLVFVDQVEGSATGLGTKEDPVTTIHDGLRIARTSGAAGVIVAGEDSTVYAEMVLLDQGVSLIGGYDSDWRPNSERPTIGGRRIGDLDGELEGAVAFGDNDVVGISIQSFSEPVVVANLVVKNDQDPSQGGTNYGVHVFEAPGVTLRNVEVFAGPGGDGRPGGGGRDGAPGADGEDGQETIVVADGGMFTALDALGEIDTALGGVNDDCPVANGGDGGRGGVHVMSSATRGRNAEIAQGGTRGDHLDNKAGGNGENAPVITSEAVDGSGGVSGGNVINGRWHAAGTGSHGEDGEHGTGGGGGGGGGSGSESQTFRIGSFGGAGGAGGCGGAGGGGGEPGGGSFGLFVVGSDIVVERSSFYADLGGEGGRGGDGGEGGAAGAGGVASVRFERGDTGQVWIYGLFLVNARGGRGGAGAAGVNGGAGGGGAGGVSYGAYCSNAQVTTVGTVTFSAGGSADGGTSAGQAGGAGVSADSFQCN